MNLPLISNPAHVAPILTVDAAAQVAALCWRVRAGATQVLLVTSRGTGRWIVPKGWHINGQTGAEAALTEAWEEAGVRGTVTPDPVGCFNYIKLLEDGTGKPVLASVYEVKVRALMKTWPEMAERRRKWMSPRKAATRVTEPELAALLLEFGRITAGLKRRV